jgi:hypothetical protein
VVEFPPKHYSRHRKGVEAMHCVGNAGYYSVDEHHRSRLGRIGRPGWNFHCYLTACVRPRRRPYHAKEFVSTVRNQGRLLAVMHQRIGIPLVLPITAVSQFRHSRAYAKEKKMN